MKIRLYVTCARQVMPVLELTPLPECQPKFSCCHADQKQVKNKNWYIIFFWWWCHYLHVPPPPYVAFFFLFWVPLSLVPCRRHFWMAPKGNIFRSISFFLESKKKLKRRNTNSEGTVAPRCQPFFLNVSFSFLFFKVFFFFLKFPSVILKFNCFLCLFFRVPL